MQNPEQVEIKLAGQKIPFKVKGTDPALLDQVVSLVTARIEAAEKRSRQGTAPHQIIMLALLDLAEDYVRAKQKTESFKHEIEENARKLLTELSEGT